MKVYKEMHATIKTMLADDDHLSGATTFDKMYRLLQPAVVSQQRLDGKTLINFINT